MADNYTSLPGARRDTTAVTQYRAVLQAATAFRVGPITNANAERPIGILQNDPAATDEPCDVALFGVCYAEYGGTVAVGDALALDDNGRVITDVEVTDGSAVDLHHIGYALEAGAVSSVHLIVLHLPIRIGLE